MRARFEPLRRSLFAPDWDCLRLVAAAALKASWRQSSGTDRVRLCGHVKPSSLNPAGYPEFPDRTVEVRTRATNGAQSALWAEINRQLTKIRVWRILRAVRFERFDQSTTSNNVTDWLIFLLMLAWTVTFADVGAPGGLSPAFFPCKKNDTAALCIVNTAYVTGRTQWRNDKSKSVLYTVSRMGGRCRNPLPPLSAGGAYVKMNTAYVKITSSGAQPVNIFWGRSVLPGYIALLAHETDKLACKIMAIAARTTFAPFNANIGLLPRWK